MKPSLVVILCLGAALIGGLSGYFISENLKSTNNDAENSSEMKNSTVKENLKLVYNLLRENVDWKKVLNNTDWKSIDIKTPAHITSIQVLLKLAQSLSSNIDANIKALQESGKDAYVVFNTGDLPIGVTIKNDHLLIAQRVLDEIRDKVNALESVLLEKSKNKSAENENTSKSEVTKADERLMISKVNITEKKWNDMNSKVVSSTTETIYSTTFDTPN